MTKQTLFTQKDCVPLPSDLVGEILVLRTDFFFDEYKRPEYQLVYFEHDYPYRQRKIGLSAVRLYRSIEAGACTRMGGKENQGYYKPQRTRSEGGCTVSRQIRKERSLFI